MKFGKCLVSCKHSIGDLVFNVWLAGRIKHEETSQIVYFTVVCLVIWPLSGSDAGVDLLLIQTLLLSKQGQLQPHFHSKARSLITY